MEIISQRLRHDEAILSKSTQNMEEMKKEVLQLQVLKMLAIILHFVLTL